MCAGLQSGTHLHTESTHTHQMLCCRITTLNFTFLTNFKQRKKWLLHIQRMPQTRIPLKSYNYRPQGRRSIGRPRKRWREQLQPWRRNGSKGPILGVYDDDDIVTSCFLFIFLALSIFIIPKWLLLTNVILLLIWAEVSFRVVCSYTNCNKCAFVIVNVTVTQCTSSVNGVSLPTDQSHGTVTVHGYTVRSPLTVCQATSNPIYRLPRYSKWTDIFRSALVCHQDTLGVVLTGLQTSTACYCAEYYRQW